MFMMNSRIRTLCLNFGDSMNLRLLFISHSLDNSGAPIVLFEIIKLCKGKGHIVDVISLDDGILHSSLEKENIHVDIADDFLDNLKKWQTIFYKYDAVIVNTLVCIEAMMLNTVPIISDVCGVSYYINNYCNSFIFKSENHKSLYYSLCKAIDFRLNQKDEYEKMQKNFRKCYEDNFEINVVANKFFSLIRNYMTF